MILEWQDSITLMINMKDTGMKNSRVIMFLVALLTLSGMLACTGHYSDHSSVAENNSTAEPSSGQFTADMLVGYWESRDDGLVTHITQVSKNSIGSGSFKDINGRLYPAGKFRNIVYIGGNKWECDEWDHPHNLIYDEEKQFYDWHPAVIEMLDKNTIKVDRTIYYRK